MNPINPDQTTCFLKKIDFLVSYRRSNNSNHIVIFVYKRAISVDKKKTTALKKWHEITHESYNNSLTRENKTFRFFSQTHTCKASWITWSIWTFFSFLMRFWSFRSMTWCNVVWWCKKKKNEGNTCVRSCTLLLVASERHSEGSSRFRLCWNTMRIIFNTKFEKFLWTHQVHFCMKNIFGLREHFFRNKKNHESWERRCILIASQKYFRYSAVIKLEFSWAKICLAAWRGYCNWSVLLSLISKPLDLLLIITTCFTCLSVKLS